MAAHTEGGGFAGVDRRRWGDTDVHWRRVLAVFNAGWGLTYLVTDADRWTSGTLEVIRGWGVPFPLWGAAVLLLAAGVTWRRTVHLAAGVLAVFWTAWGSAQMATVITGAAEAGGGPWFCWLAAAVHGFQMTRPHAPRVQP